MQAEVLAGGLLLAIALPNCLPHPHPAWALPSSGQTDYGTADYGTECEGGGAFWELEVVLVLVLKQESLESNVQVAGAKERFLWL